MSTPTEPTSECRDRTVSRRWLPWGLGVVIVLGVLVPTILLPATNRIYLGLEERRINKAFQQHDIEGVATWQGRLFDGVLYVEVEEIDDSRMQSVAEALNATELRFPLHIRNSHLSEDGLRYLKSCRNLRYVQFIDTPISDIDIEGLKRALPNTSISKKITR